MFHAIVNIIYYLFQLALFLIFCTLIGAFTVPITKEWLRQREQRNFEKEQKKLKEKKP